MTVSALLLAEADWQTQDAISSRPPWSVEVPQRDMPYLHDGDSGMPMVACRCCFAASVNQSARWRTSSGRRSAGRVIDGTGLTGLYDFETDLPVDAQAAAEGARRAGIVVTPEAIQNLSNDDAPAMTSVLQQRLGLRLETRKASVPVVVIDSVDMPTPD